MELNNAKLHRCTKRHINCGAKFNVHYKGLFGIDCMNKGNHAPFYSLTGGNKAKKKKKAEDVEDCRAVVAPQWQKGTRSHCSLKIGHSQIYPLFYYFFLLL